MGSIGSTILPDFIDIKPFVADEYVAETQNLFNKTHITDDKARQIFQLSQNALQNVLTVKLAGTNQEMSSSPVQHNAPELTQPKPVAETGVKLTGNAQFTLLIGQVMELLGNVSLNELASRLQVSQARMAGFIESNNAQAKEFATAVAGAEQALTVANSDLAALGQAKLAMAELQRVVDQAAEKLSRLAPGDEGYAEAQKTLANAQSELNTAAGRVAQAEAKAANSSEIARDKALAVENLFDRIKMAGGQPTPQSEKHLEQSLDAMSRMMYLMSQFIELVDKNSQRTLENDSKVFQRIQETVQKDMKKQAEKATQEMQKAATLNKAMGCAGKILGGLITALSVVGAAFTGGASLAFAAVGVALMVGDQIGKAVTGTSFMEKMLNPVMEKVLQPLIAALTKAITNMLESMGVNSAAANLIGSIVGAAIAVALVVAVVLVGKSAASKFMTSALGKMLTEAMKKIVPDVIKNLSTKSGAMVSNGVKRLTDRVSLKSDPVSMQKYAGYMNQANSATTFAGTGVTAGLGIARGLAEKNVHDALAKMTLADGVLELIKQLLTRLVEQFGESQAMSDQEVRNLHQRMSNAAATTNFVARAIAA